MTMLFTTLYMTLYQLSLFDTLNLLPGQNVLPHAKAQSTLLEYCFARFIISIAINHRTTYNVNAFFQIFAFLFFSAFSLLPSVCMTNHSPTKVIYTRTNHVSIDRLLCIIFITQSTQIVCLSVVNDIYIQHLAINHSARTDYPISLPSEYVASAANTQGGFGIIKSSLSLIICHYLI